MDSRGGKLHALVDDMKGAIGEDHVFAFYGATLHTDGIVAGGRILTGLTTESGLSTDEVTQHTVLPFGIFLAFMTIDIGGSDIGTLLDNIVQPEEISPSGRAAIDIAGSGWNGQLSVADIETVEGTDVHRGRCGGAKANASQISGMGKNAATDMLHFLRKDKPLNTETTVEGIAVDLSHCGGCLKHRVVVSHQAGRVIIIR